ncbi:hypothetical protein [Deinococcus koreensis]|uniref:Glycosyl-4,4'-diaponeurosporenoate acyltransferase n=1 Tax=Deinococcus koreensis TaxID=2054903 RepID=A0A2K3UTK5_9DEIO|nr:hypothetical protein [Deinococcus koreensis]PNY79866.1 hypothetical protein CVO96_18175 [Deinococcus koreensis]
MKRPSPQVSRRLAAGLAGALGVAGLTGRLTAFRGPLFAVALHAPLMRWAVDALPALEPELRGRWFRVRPWEAPLYQRLGVYPYRRLLRAVGWERFRQGALGFDGTRASLLRYERATREAETNHLLLGALGLGVAAGAVARRAWGTAGWHLAVTALLHAYPVMLQRTLRARLGRLRRPTS